MGPIKGGIVLVDPTTAQVQRVIALQYNAESPGRELKGQDVGGRGRSDAEPTLQGPGGGDHQLRGRPGRDRPARISTSMPPPWPGGLVPADRAAGIVVAAQQRAVEQGEQPGQLGQLEIAPMLAPLLLLVCWGASRVIPVKLTSFSVTEEAFDPALNPIHAKASFGLRVPHRR